MTRDEIIEQHAHDLLSSIAGIDRDMWEAKLSGRGLPILRAAADLCGADAADLTKQQAITAITENF